MLTLAKPIHVSKMQLNISHDCLSCPSGEIDEQLKVHQRISDLVYSESELHMLMYCRNVHLWVGHNNIMFHIVNWTAARPLENTSQYIMMPAV